MKMHPKTLWFNWVTKLLLTLLHTSYKEHGYLVNPYPAARPAPFPPFLAFPSGFQPLSDLGQGRARFLERLVPDRWRRIGREGSLGRL